MKIVRMATCCAVVAFATGVATPQTQAEMIVGAWNCSADAEGGVVTGRMTYNADGSTDSALTIDLDVDGENLIAQVETKSSWKLTGGGVIEEQILEAVVNSAKVDGVDLPEAVRVSIEDSMMEELGPSTIELTSTQMVLVDGEGTRTVCTR